MNFKITLGAENVHPKVPLMTNCLKIGISCIAEHCNYRLIFFWQAQEMINLAKTKGTFLMEAVWSRTFPAYKVRVQKSDFQSWEGN